MKKIFLLLVFFLIVCYPGYSQGEIDSQTKIFYRNERSLAFLLNSNGYGINGRFGKRIDARNKKLYAIDIVGIKHPKEIRTSNVYFNTRGFVYGKLNTFINIRTALGKQHEMFRKIDRGGIAIRYFYTGGLSIGLLKPIYYIVQYNEALLYISPD